MAAPARALGAAASTAPEPPLYWSLAPDTDAVFRGKFETCVQIFRNWVSPVRSLEGATILDFGCGDGVMALGICLQLGGAHVIGVELTPDFSGLGEAAERILGLDALPSNLELHLLAPGQRIAGRFRPDVVFSWSVFEHVSRESLDEVVLDLHDALAPGGHAFVQVAPLFYSARGSHLFGIVDEPWEHLRTQEDRLRARVLEASLPADSRLTPDEYERHKTQAWSCYETLNRLTADELIELFRRNGFELVSEYRTLCEEQPGAELLSVHGESVLRTEQVVALFRRR